MEQEFEQSDSEQIKKRLGMNKVLLILISILVTSILLTGGFYYYHTKELNKKNSEIDNLNARIDGLNSDLESLEEALVLSQTKIAMLECEGVWEESKGCIANNLTLLTPNGGDSYCLGETIKISWKGPKDLEAVSIWLSTPNTGSSNLGEYLGVNRVEGDIGYGEYDWTGNNVVGKRVVPKDFYKIDISSRYGDEVLEDSSDSIFSLKNCQE